MVHLLNTIKNTINDNIELPFSVYTSSKEQRLLNVSIAKPLLIVILNGDKALGNHNELMCHSGDFIFLGASPAINIRNIPVGQEYYALLIEFDYQDFKGLESKALNAKDYFVGKTTQPLEKCLQQFVEASTWAPKGFWSLRKREIISLLCQIGYQEILTLLGSPKIKDKLHEMFIEQEFNTFTVSLICEQFAMSESTLRRKLKLEGTTIQEVKDQARLGLALHLLQTSKKTIGLIADQCGYQSQSRFTERFKKRFGLTPSELKKTKMTD